MDLHKRRLSFDWLFSFRSKKDQFLKGKHLHEKKKIGFVAVKNNFKNCQYLEKKVRRCRCFWLSCYSVMLLLLIGTNFLYSENTHGSKRVFTLLVNEGCAFVW